VLLLELKVLQIGKSHSVCLEEVPKDGLSLGWRGAEVEGRVCQAASLPVPGGRMVKDVGEPKGTGQLHLEDFLFFKLTLF